MVSKFVQDQSTPCIRVHIFSPRLNYFRGAGIDTSSFNSVDWSPYFPSRTELLQGMHAKYENGSVQLSGDIGYSNILHSQTYKCCGWMPYKLGVMLHMSSQRKPMGFMAAFSTSALEELDGLLALFKRIPILKSFISLMLSLMYSRRSTSPRN